jgi:hypothetical protein
MEKNTLSDAPLWKEFQKAARAKRRNPVRLLTEYMRECIEIWEDQKLDEEIQRDARRSGFREEDAVEIVRAHRLEKKGQRAAP